MRKLICCHWLLPAALCAVVLVAFSPVAIVAEDEKDHAPAAEKSEKTGEDQTGDRNGSHAGGGHDTTVPLNFKTDLALWSLVTFLVFLFVLKTFAWGPLIQGLDNRESRVKNDIAEAEAARRKAEQMLKEHQAKLAKVQDEVREILAEARRDAEHTKNDIIATAQKEADASKQRAIQEIRRAEDQALRTIFDEMAGAVAQATEQVLGRAISGDDEKRYIDEALTQISAGR